MYFKKYGLNQKEQEIKDLFINITKNMKSSEIKTASLFFNSNEFTNETFPEEQFENYIKFIKDNPKDKMSKNYFKVRYGEERYLEFYNKRKEKSKKTLENYITKFGEEEGLNKWNSYIEKQKSSSKRNINYWLKKCNNDMDLAKHKLKVFQTSHTKKYLRGKNQEEIDQYNRENSSWRIEYWTKRGYSKEQAMNEIRQIKKESSMFCKERYLKEGYGDTEAIKMAHEWWTKNCKNNANSTSKESMKLFTPFIEELSKLDDIYIYYGDKENGKEEWFLYDSENRKYYFYDLTIMYKEVRLIIEYNGEAFHPNRDKLNESEWENWEQLFTNKSADLVYDNDMNKKNLAINNNFKYLEVWSSDENDFNKNEIFNFLNSYKLIE